MKNDINKSLIFFHMEIKAIETCNVYMTFLEFWHAWN